MRIKLTSRLGQNQPGSIIDVTKTEADWLFLNGHARPADEHQAEPQDEPAEDDTADSDSDDLTGLTLAELKTKAEELGLPTYGNKAQLAGRIAEAQENDD